MTDFLLALAFVVTLLFGHWIMSRMDRFLDSVEADGDGEDARR